MSTPHRTYGKDLFDLAIIGNGAAAAGAVARLKQRLSPRGEAPLEVVVLEADTERERAARMPEYNARVTFPRDLEGLIPRIDDTVITWYDTVAFYAHRGAVRKELPPDKVALVDVDRLIELAEADLPPNVTVKLHKQVCDARYVDSPRGELVELTVQYPFGEEKVFEVTDTLYARAVLDCGGTASMMLDKMQGYRQDTKVVCGVLAFKVIGAHLPNPREVSLGLDDSITHGAGSWAYPNDGLSPALAAHLQRWFSTTDNARVRQLIAGKSVEDFRGTIADVGISSMSTYANVQHYQGNLERQVADLFYRLPAYRDMFMGAAVIPGSAFFKPSPVLQPVEVMGGRRYLLAGDAAGHATPYIGEGIRPGVEMGAAAIDVLLPALKRDDLGADRLQRQYAERWWERYGRYDVWSDLFRHFSSTCFTDKQWDTFFARLRGLTPTEFYGVLRSEYTLPVVAKMFPYDLIPHYLTYNLHRGVDALLHKLTVRSAQDWIA